MKKWIIKEFARKKRQLLILKTGFDKGKVSPSPTEDGIMTEDEFPFIQHPKNLEESQRWLWQALHQGTHLL